MLAKIQFEATKKCDPDFRKVVDYSKKTYGEEGGLRFISEILGIGTAEALKIRLRAPAAVQARAIPSTDYSQKMGASDPNSISSISAPFHF
jgi:hypothetical protein